jgi:hypothetical protein
LDDKKAIALGQMTQAAQLTPPLTSSQCVHFCNQQLTNAHEHSTISGMDAISANMSAQEHTRLTNLHDTFSPVVSTDQSGSLTSSTISSDDPSPGILAMMTKQKAVLPGDI